MVTMSFGVFWEVKPYSLECNMKSTKNEIYPIKYPSQFRQPKTGNSELRFTWNFSDLIPIELCLYGFLY
jgi:hypothetical protein